jgi:methylated-DNA-[protein]-cysteine S-methyltransferase
MNFKNPVRACTRYESPLGTMLVAASDTGIAGVWFDGQRHGPDSSGWREDPQHPVLREAVAQLRAYFSGERDGFDLPLDLDAGTPFQRSVWSALLAIPRGATTSYAQLARQLGKRRHRGPSAPPSDAIP